MSEPANARGLYRDLKDGAVAIGDGCTSAADLCDAVARAIADGDMGATVEYTQAVRAMLETTYLAARELEDRVITLAIAAFVKQKSPRANEEPGG